MPVKESHFEREVSRGAAKMWNSQKLQPEGCLIFDLQRYSCRMAIHAGGNGLLLIQNRPIETQVLFYGILKARVLAVYRR